RRRALRPVGRAAYPARLQPGLQRGRALEPVLRGLQPARRTAGALPGLAREHAAERTVRPQLRGGHEAALLTRAAHARRRCQRAVRAVWIRSRPCRRHAGPVQGRSIMSSRFVRRFACPLSLLALALAACTGGQDAPAAAPLDAVADAAQSAQARDIPVIDEAFQSTMTPEDNIDSVASWTAPDGAVWVIATAKSTDRLVVYDGHTGQTLRTVGSLGAGEGEFDRPNGVAVADDLAFVVERDNHRV